MKNIKELKFEELTVEQKLGFSTVFKCDAAEEEDADYIESLIRERKIGAIWVAPRNEEALKLVKRLKDAADYPLLVFTDAEAGLGEYLIGRQNTVAVCNSDELAYTFGKVTALKAREWGYNVVCNPVVDMCKGNAVCGGVIRSLGSDKKRVTELAAQIARGAHDAGVLTVAKHFPGRDPETDNIDNHLAPSSSQITREELLDYNLYPFLELDKKGFIDGVMLSHRCFEKIDAEYPMSLSKSGIQILRDEGFSGFAVTDALAMMSIAEKYGKYGSIAIAVDNARAFALPFLSDNASIMKSLKESYESGKITDESLDAVVKSTLEAQHKVLTMQPKFDAISDEDKLNFKRINTDSVFAKADEGLSHTVSRDARHCFVLLTATEIDLRDDTKVGLDTMKTDWYHPYKIKERLNELFPNSYVTSINEYPSPSQISNVMREITGFNTGEPYDDVVFITFYQSQTYVGRECLTTRIVALIEGLVLTKRIAALVHYGNPYIVEDLPHIPRVIIGAASPTGVMAGLDVLAGNYPAKGALTYDVKFR